MKDLQQPSDPTHRHGDSIGRRLFRVVFFMSLSSALAAGMFGFFISNYNSVEEQLVTHENLKLRTELQILEERIRKASASLNELIEKDDYNYRVILDADPLSSEIREAGTGGYESFDRYEIQNIPELVNNYEAMEKLEGRLEVESRSFEELQNLLNERISMWASRPAIQPINNTQLNQLYMSYGARFHPIYKVMKEHHGLDFSAPKGTPVYATGDGQVARASTSGSYGKVIYLNHGHEYETRYAHLSRFAVRPGAFVKRGQVIGYVGSTGTSLSSHLHYEVLYRDRNVNPINFFQRDLSNKEYEKLIEIASLQNDALD
ncbi:MAG: M23 family metallopeptidase [Chryseolinea sp.]